MGLDFVAIDFETACGNRESACAVGAVRVRDGVIVGSFFSLVNPNMPFSPMNINIHKITPDMVEDALTFDQLWPELKNFINGDSLVAYNASFDVGVLTASLERYGIEEKLLSVCSMTIAKVVYQGMKSYRMKELCKRFDIPYGHHRPDADALSCAMLTLRMAEEVGATTLDELIDKTNVDLKAAKKETLVLHNSQKIWQEMEQVQRDILLAIWQVMVDHGAPRELLRFWNFADCLAILCYEKVASLYSGKRGIFLSLPDGFTDDIDDVEIDAAPKKYGVKRRALISCVNDIERLKGAINLRCDECFSKYQELSRYMNPLEGNYYTEQLLFPADWE